MLASGLAITLTPVVILSLLAHALPASGCHARQTVSARNANTYVCNETHFRALQAATAAAAGAAEACRSAGAASHGHGRASRLKAAFFVHVPYPEVAEDYEPLADALQELLLRLVDRSLAEAEAAATRGSEAGDNPTSKGVTEQR